MIIQFVTLNRGKRAWLICDRQLPVRIGRHPDVAIRLNDESVSDFHCEVDGIRGVLWVRDVGSLHGTFVNGFHVTQSHLLPGDWLTVGGTSMQVHYVRRLPPAIEMNLL